LLCDLAFIKDAFVLREGLYESERDR